VAGPSEPKKRRSAQAPVPDEVAAKLQAQRTVELDTADLEELGQSGVIIKKTIDLARAKLVPVDTTTPKIIVAVEPPVAQPGASGVVVDDSLTIAELPEQQLGALAGQRDIRTQYVRRVSTVHPVARTAKTRGSGMWIVVLVYLLAATALAVSLYFRFVA
jgi:hypothetical protein